MTRTSRSNDKQHWDFDRLYYDPDWVPLNYCPHHEPKQEPK